MSGDALCRAAQPAHIRERPGPESGARPASHRPGLNLSETQDAPPRADFPHGSAALRCIGRSDTEAGAMSPLHLARAKPARHALGTEPSPAPPRSAGGNAPPIIPSGPCFCTAPPPTRPLERLVWPKPARLPATAAGDFFPPPAMPALHREAKKTARRRQPLRSALRVRAGRPPSHRQPSRPRQARSRSKKGLTT